jgi:hypothetical protein
MMRFTFKTTNKNAVGYYQQAYSDRIFSIQDLINYCVSESGEDLIPEGMGLGRIDLACGDVICLDFSLSSSRVGKETNGASLGGGSIGTGIWGNQWVVSMSSMTMSGERHLVKQFKFTQPMLSRYSCSTSDASVRRKHSKLVKDHLERCTDGMISFLKHYLKRVQT